MNQNLLRFPLPLLHIHTDVELFTLKQNVAVQHCHLVMELLNKLLNDFRLRAELVLQPSI